MAGRKTLSFCREFEVPCSNLAFIHFMVSFSLCFLASRLSKVTWAGARKLSQKRNRLMTENEKQKGKNNYLMYTTQTRVKWKAKK